MSHKGRNRDPGRMPREPAVTHKKPTALMEAQLESLSATPVLNSSRRAINDFSPRLTPRSKRNSRPDLCEADVIAPIDPRVLCRPATFLFRSRAALQAEIFVLRHQLNVLRRKSPKRVFFSNIDRLVFDSETGD